MKPPKILDKIADVVLAYKPKYLDSYNRTEGQLRALEFSR